jgi:Uma2 family endonuclease
MDGKGMRISTSILQNAFGKYLKMAMEGTTIYVEKNQRPVAVLKGIGEEESFSIHEEAVVYEAPKRYTYEEFRAIADREENTRQYELIDGQIYMLASPMYQHQVAMNEVFVQFYNWFKKKPCRPLTAPFDVKLFGTADKFEDNPNVVQPDILVICDEDRINEKGAYDGKPVLVVEVLSPSTKSKDIMVKSQLYMASGIEEYWIIDTEAKCIIIYHFRDRKLWEQQIVTKGQKASSKVFEGLEVDSDDIYLD